MSGEVVNGESMKSTRIRASLRRGAVALLVVFTVAASDGGAFLGAEELDFSLSNTTGVRSNSGDASGARLAQENRLDTSLRWDPTRSLRIRASGFVSVRTDFADGAAVGGDLRTLVLEGEYPVASQEVQTRAQDRAQDQESARGAEVPPRPGRAFARSPVFGFSVGRQPLSEFSGFVMDTHVDGVALSYTSPRVDVSAAGGYVGLQLRNANTLQGAPTEMADADNPFAPSRALGRLSIAFPEILSRQSILLTGIGQYDMPELATAGQAAAEETGRYHSMHIGTGVTGPISRQLFYTLFGYYYRPWVGIPSDTLESGNGFAGGGSVRYYVEELAYSSIQLRGAIASGDDERRTRVGAEGDDSGHFVPITDPVVNELLNVAFTNVWLGEVSYSFRPFAPDFPSNTGLRIQIGVQALGRPAAGPGSVTDLDPEAPAGYLGTAANAEIRYRPTSDLTVSVTGSSLSPSDPAVTGGLLPSDRPLFRAALEARIAF